jgi:hypothetical protein
VTPLVVMWPGGVTVVYKHKASGQKSIRLSQMLLVQLQWGGHYLETGLCGPIGRSKDPGGVTVGYRHKALLCSTEVKDSVTAATQSAL